MIANVLKSSSSLCMLFYFFEQSVHLHCLQEAGYIRLVNFFTQLHCRKNNLMQEYLPREVHLSYK